MTGGTGSPDAGRGARGSSCSAAGSPVSAPRASSRRRTSTSCSSTRTTTTASSRCSTSSRRACSTRRRSRIRCATSSSTSRTRPSTRQPSRRSISTAARCSSRDMPPLHYDYLVIGLGAWSSSSAARARRSTRSRSTRVEDALRLRSHIVGRWEAADRDPSLVDDGALNVVVVGGGPTGSRASAR